MSIKPKTNNPQPTNWFRKIVTGGSLTKSHLIISAAILFAAIAASPTPARAQEIERFTVARDETHRVGLRFPDLAQAANGDLVLVYAEAEVHNGGPTATIAAQTSVDNGRTWSGRIVVNHTTPYVKNCPEEKQGWLTNPRLIRLQDRTLLLAVDRMPVPRPTGAHRFWHNANSLVEFYRSADNGRTWTRPEKSPIRGVVPGLIQLRDGALLVNVTQFDEDKDYRQYLVVYRSTDNGRTWTGPATLARHPQRQPNEGGFVQLATGEVICYMRDDEYSLKNSTGLKTISRDGGLTWSPAHGSGPWCYSGRPCPGQLKDGSVLVTTRVRNAPQAGNWFGLYLEPAETALQANPLDSAPPPQARWTLLDNDTHKERPDWGYSGWVELADGSLFIVQYTADGAPKDKTCIRGYRLPKGWPGKLGRGDGAPDKPAPPDKKPQSSGSTPDS